VGVGIGKSRDVQQAIQKGYDQAVKNAIKVKLKNGTIAHTVMANYKGAMVLMRPARPGTGVIAGGTARTVADLAGLTDLVAKRFGSSNRLSNARACLKALDKISK
jgi:small subunit ribosomal protein S5